MRCLYCGKEYWLPSQIRRDPDFCSAPHREKYNSLVERALQCIQQAAPLTASEPLPAPVAAAPSLQQPSPEAQAAAGHAPDVRSAVTANAVPRPPREISVPAPPATTPHFPIPPAGPASVGSEGPLVPRPSRFRASPHIPPLSARPVFEPLAEQAPRAPNPAQQRAVEDTLDQKDTAAPQMFGLLETGQAAWHKTGRLVLTAVAACAAVGAVLWIGASAARLGKTVLNAPVSETAAPQIAPASRPATPPQPASLEHSIGWFRSAAIQHSAVQLSETFETGMAAWGVPSTRWAPGWSHSPDGYVRPGQFALYQPTLGYDDYRMEFFGEIENKSLSWAVRGKDLRNYYAMRLALTRPGLRPLLSLAHYPVVDGKPGHAVEVPLSVMIHNGVPYHIAVQVQGSTYRVWIEGEPVDSWSDDTFPAGGVGFFAEPGAHARIYWLSVSKNDNWFGWLCARIMGDSPARPTYKARRGAI